MKRVTLIAIALAVAIAALFYWNTDNAKDRRVWQRFTAELTEQNVTQIEFGGTKRFTLTEADRKELLALLRAAKFDRSNRAGNGPTPQAVISLTFKDGHQVHIGLWGMTTFELSPRHLDPRSQFLVQSQELGIWLKNRFSGPTIGAAGFSAAAPFFCPPRTDGRFARSM